MAQPGTLIERSLLVTDFFGHWPGFYHAEIISVFLYRNYPMEPKMLMRLYAFEKSMGGLILPGFGKTKHCLIEFEFLELRDTRLESFNAVNKLSAIHFTAEEESVRVEFVPASGTRISLLAGRIRVKSLRKINEDPKDTLDKF